MIKEELLKELKKLNKLSDKEHAHGRADELLIEYIGDKDIKKAFEKIELWYA